MLPFSEVFERATTSALVIIDGMLFSIDLAARKPKNYVGFEGYKFPLDSGEPLPACEKRYRKRNKEAIDARIKVLASQQNPHVNLNNDEIKKSIEDLETSIAFLEGANEFYTKKESRPENKVCVEASPDSFTGVLDKVFDGQNLMLLNHRIYPLELSSNEEPGWCVVMYKGKRYLQRPAKQRIEHCEISHQVLFELKLAQEAKEFLDDSPAAKLSMLMKQYEGLAEGNVYEKDGYILYNDFFYLRSEKFLVRQMPSFTDMINKRTFKDREAGVAVWLKKDNKNVDIRERLQYSNNATFVVWANSRYVPAETSDICVHRDYDKSVNDSMIQRMHKILLHMDGLAASILTYNKIRG
ncbi:hypothetical protein HY486_02680 [Candidatus Woesearchaeota archaeon]|nr:hypothetical protein [Candidatus Woesearchaeota archaeon]